MKSWKIHQKLARGILLFGLGTQICFARIEENPCVHNVIESFKIISTAPRSNLAIRTNGKVPGRQYTQGVLAYFGLENHFQGITRIRDTKFLVLSAANYWNKTANLFVVKMGSREENKDFGSNLNSKGKIPKSDRFISRIDIKDPVEWHVGGISSLGDILLVPLSVIHIPWKKKPAYTSRILFYDLSNPKLPVKIPVEINRPGVSASSVAMTRLSDGRFLVLVDGLDASPKKLYYSRTQKIEDGFSEVESSLQFGFNATKPVLIGEGLALINQCDGKLFYSTFKNDGIAAPVLNGQNHLTVFQIVNNKLQLEASYEMDCNKWCNFSAATSMSISSDQRLRVYSSHFYRNWIGTHLRFSEFSE